MNDIQFSKTERATIVAKLQAILDTEFEVELGQFQVEFLLRFFETELGVFFYNRGVQDAQVSLSQYFEQFSDVLYQLEKPVPR